MNILLFNKRHKLAKMFEKWCKENNVDSNDTTNMITWLHMNDLLNEETVEKILKESE